MSSKVNIGGVWKNIINSRVNIGGVWKNITRMSINIGGIWKSVYGVYTNILGVAGSCENIGYWESIYGGTLTTNGNHVEGSYSLRWVQSWTDGYFACPVTLSTNKYYFLSAYGIADPTRTLMVNLNTDSGGSNTIATLNFTDSTGFIRLGAKGLSYGKSIGWSNVNCGFSSYTTGTGYVDAIMVQEITADEYNNYSVAELLELYPFTNT